MTHHDCKLAIIRTLARPIDPKFYNSQELGLGRALLKHGVSTDVYVASDKRELTATTIEEDSGVNLRLIECPFRKLPVINQAWLPKVARSLRENNYDLIHVNESNEIESWRIARLAQRMGIPLLLYQGMYQSIPGRVQSKFQAIFDRLLLPSLRRNTTLALGKTQRAAQFLKTRGFDSPGVLPVGLDPAPLNTQSSTDWRAKLAIPENQILILYVGVLEERRNPTLILELAVRNPEFAFVIAGTGPQFDSIQQKVRERQLANLHLLGQITQESLPELYRCSDLSLLPSNYEIYGMTVLESMYFGVPVLASKTAGPESIIDHEENGWLVDCMTVDKWHNTLARITTSQGFLEDIGKKAKHKINNKLTWHAIAGSYIELINSTKRI